MSAAGEWGSVLERLGARLPVIAAPMAGGPTTPELVLAAADAGALGVLAAGYKTPQLLAEQIATVRDRTATYGVNLFAPNPVPVDRDAYTAYRDALRTDAERLHVELPASPREDDDYWRAKIDVLLDQHVPVVSFTFGIPEQAVLAALRRQGSVLVQTVTSADEARQAAEAGLDVLAVQGPGAGGHSGTLTPQHIPPDRPLADVLAEVQHAVALPTLAAGGIADASAVAGLVRSGAAAVLVGTALLLAPEAGTSPAYRAALLGPARGETFMTRAFTGRPARALPNAFTAAHHAYAPAGYPALHHLTSPMRRAAAGRADPEYVNLWAGTGYRSVREQPAATTLVDFTKEL